MRLISRDGTDGTIRHRLWRPSISRPMRLLAMRPPTQLLRQTQGSTTFYRRMSSSPNLLAQLSAKNTVLHVERKGANKQYTKTVEQARVASNAEHLYTFRTAQRSAIRSSSLMRVGKLAEAERMYRDALAIEPLEGHERNADGSPTGLKQCFPIDGGAERAAPVSTLLVKTSCAHTPPNPPVIHICAPL